jgi:hypothetical protein
VRYIFIFRINFNIMEKRNRKIVLNSIAGIFILTVVLVYYSFIAQRAYSSLLWMCYIAMIIMAAGILMRKPNLIVSQMMILLIPDLLWVFDFIAILITGNSVLGVSKYFFMGNRTILQEILSLQHFYTIPLSLWALSIIKIKRNYKPLIISSAEIIILFFFSLFIFPLIYIDSAINCLPNSIGCTFMQFTHLIPYPIIWLIISLSFVIVSYFAIIFIPFIQKKK